MAERKMKMKKKWIIAILASIFLVSQPVWADTGLEWPEVDRWLKETEDNAFLQRWGISSMEEMIEKIISKELQLSVGEFVQILLSILWAEMGQYGVLILEVAALAVLSYLLQNMSSEFTGSTISEAGFMAVYAGILVLLLKSFKIPLELTRSATENIAYLSTMLVPALAALAAASGKITGAVGHSTLVLSGLSLLLMIFQKVFITLTAGLAVAEAVNFLSPKTVLDKLMTLGRSLVQKGIKLLCSLFLLIMSAAGMVLPAADKFLNKAGGTLVSAVPIVGGAVSEAMDTVLAGTMMIKNGAGAAACILVACICLIPLGKVAAAWLVYRLMGALLAPVSDPRVSGLTEAMGRQTSLLLSILGAGMIIFTGAVGIFVYSTT